MAILKVTFIILEVLFLFNVLIFVHELGHFLAARWRGLKVDRFAIWFGKPIWKRTMGGVEYALGWIPAGGYVALPQMASMEAIEGKSESSGSDKPLPNISALDKIIVAFAGPLFSFLLALFFAVIVWKVGTPEYMAERTTKVGYVVKDGPAWNAGLRPGDEIKEIDGFVVNRFSGVSEDSITWRIVSSEGTNVAIKYLRDKQEFTTYAVPFIGTNAWYDRKALRKLQIGPAVDALVAEVATNSPAARAGITTGDRIVAVNGKSIASPDPVFDAEMTATNESSQPVTLTILRGANTLDVTLLAESPSFPTNHPPLFGILSFKLDSNVILVYPDPAKQVKQAANQIFATIRTISSRKSDVGITQLGSAVMIIRAYKNFFEMHEGWRKVLWFSVILNVNLALLNMLPFPVLDGGHITLALIEAVRRRAVNPRILNYIQTGCALLLIVFMIRIGALDVVSWVRDARASQDVVIQFEPKK